MKTPQKMILMSLAMILACLFSPQESFPLSNIDSLSGLEGVEVLVEELGADLENFNLTPMQIQSEVESKLRMAGIKILSKEENAQNQPLRKPYLYIKVHSFKPPWKREVFVFNVEIALKQQVLLRESPKSSKKLFYAATWYKSTLGAIGSNRISEIRDVVNDLTDKFINAYLTANPKK